MNFSEKNHKHFQENNSYVSKIRLTLLALLISIAVIGQNGINYKALIKDANGNVLESSSVSMQFIIYEGSALTNNVYQESHTINTDANGFVVVNIGEGTTSDLFTDINWSNDEHFLNVQVNTRSGLIDVGTTAFKTVPYAKVAENVTGLEALDEGNGIGWRLVGRDPNNYGNIGRLSIDLSISTNLSTIYGATGNNSTALGRGTRASGDRSTSMGISTIASGANSTAMGIFTEASGSYSTAMGLSTVASGSISTAIGRDTNADAYISTAIGRYNVGGGNPTSWVDTDPLFEIGNGTSDSARNNALTVYKSGRMSINSSSNGLEINSLGSYGIAIGSLSNYGIRVYGANEYGGRFEGDLAAIFAKADINANPDIILGGDSGSANDDGILTSEPVHPSSDLLFRSNDDVIIELDDNDDESGAFIVRGGDDNGVFSVTEDGTIRQNGSTIHASDRRLKKDIENLNYGLNAILQLEPKKYFWKDKEQNKKLLGLIAQDVQPIINEIVFTQDDDAKTLGISYAELIPVLIKAIKEQQTIINSQKEINIKQDQQYKTLLSRIEHLEANKSN